MSHVDREPQADSGRTAKSNGNCGRTTKALRKEGRLAGSFYRVVRHLVRLSSSIPLMTRNYVAIRVIDLFYHLHPAIEVGSVVDTASALIVQSLMRYRNSVETLVECGPLNAYAVNSEISFVARASVVAPMPRDHQVSQDPSDLPNSAAACATCVQSPNI